MPRVEEDFEEPEPEPVPEPPAPAPPEEPEPEPPPEAPALAKIVGDRIEIAQEIQFQHDSDVILPDSYWVLVAIQTVLDEHPEVAHLLIEGHASVEGSIEYNWDLSNRRAAAVFRWLVDAGVNSSRLSWRGMGEVIPRGRGHGDAQRHGDVRDMDRRVEFHIVRRLEQWVDETPDWSRDAPPVPWRTPEEELEAEAARAAGALGGPAAAPEAEPGSSPEPSLEPAPPLDDEERMEALQRAVESDRAGDRQTADDDRGDDDSGDDDSAPGDEDWEPLIPDEEDPFEEEDDDSSTPGEAP
jgi:outer membrane protein OmpA-like peptidoglycan-associated protein